MTLQFWKRKISQNTRNCFLPKTLIRSGDSVRPQSRNPISALNASIERHVLKFCERPLTTIDGAEKSLVYSPGPSHAHSLVISSNRRNDVEEEQGGKSPAHFRALLSFLRIFYKGPPIIEDPIETAKCLSIRRAVRWVRQCQDGMSIHHTPRGSV